MKNRLYQGPFPQYEPEPVVPGSSVVMSTMPSDKVLNNFGMGMTTYVCDEHGLPGHYGNDLKKQIQDLVDLEFGQKLYIRCDWRDIQKESGKLDFADFWQIALSKQLRKTKGSVFASNEPAL